MRSLGNHLLIGGNQGLIIVDPGEIQTDAFGLETCSTVFKCPMDRWGLIPSLFSPNPFVGYLAMEKRHVSISPEGNRGFLVITGEYAGVPADTRPIYEVSVGVGEEPIETHPKFVSDIAGSPSSPKNGAIFLDETGQATGDDAKGVFDKFRSSDGSGGRNLFAGISSYLEADQITFRKSWVSRTIITGAGVGRIQAPSGPAPGLNGGNWIKFSVSAQQRGIVYFVTEEWRASGTKGWNTVIYGGG